MTRKRRRLLVVLGGMAILGVAAALVLSAFEESLVFFYSPSDIVTKEVGPERRFRLGGLVEEESVERSADGLTTTFRVTDLEQSVAVSYKGMLPDLFREGQGVVAEGRLDSAGVFVATQVLAKHDETYMPPEVAEALQKSGRWQGNEESKQ
jgi:cytochrome c-type biogenesis protein CcmE